MYVLVNVVAPLLEFPHFAGIDPEVVVPACEKNLESPSCSETVGDHAVLT